MTVERHAHDASERGEPPRAYTQACPPTCPTTSPHAHPRRTQDFLSIVGMSFADKVRRTSFLPEPAPPPASVPEALEAVFVSEPRVAAYQELMAGLSQRLAATQAHLGEVEAGLTHANPPVFREVQVSCSSGGGGEVCRGRNVQRNLPPSLHQGAHAEGRLATVTTRWVASSK